MAMDHVAFNAIDEFLCCHFIFSNDAEVGSLGLALAAFGPRHGPMEPPFFK